MLVYTLRVEVGLDGLETLNQIHKSPLSAMIAAEKHAREVDGPDVDIFWTAMSVQGVKAGWFIGEGVKHLVWIESALVLDEKA